MSLAVVKVGGSLYDLPDLGDRLRRWLPTLEASRVLLVPGGGAAVDVVREFTRLHRIGEEDAHWLALRAVAMNAHFLASLLPGTPLVQHPAGFADGWAILDPFAFARADESSANPLPHTWAVTSDAVAARAAQVAAARQVVLLKSVTIPAATRWHEAAQQGWVDSVFAGMVTSEIDVSTINLRMT
jgi:aspartokinase-like uncharacterized kinase